MKTNFTIIITLILMSFSVFANETSNNDLKSAKNPPVIPSRVISGIATIFEISHVRIDHNGKGFVTFTNDLTGNIPACTNFNTNPPADTYSRMLSFDTNSEGGKAIYSLVLSAYLSGKKITAYGTGSCLQYDGLVESWAWGSIVD